MNKYTENLQFWNSVCFGVSENRERGGGRL